MKRTDEKNQIRSRTKRSVESADSHYRHSGSSPPSEALPLIKEMWTPEDVFERFKLKKSYQKKLRSEGRIPFVKIGRLIRYIPKQISEWIQDGKAADTRSQAFLNATAQFEGNGGRHVS